MQRKTHHIGPLAFAGTVLFNAYIKKKLTPRNFFRNTQRSAADDSSGLDAKTCFKLISMEFDINDQLSFNSTLAPNYPKCWWLCTYVLNVGGNVNVTVLGNFRAKLVLTVTTQRISLCLIST